MWAVCDSQMKSPTTELLWELIFIFVLKLFYKVFDNLFKWIMEWHEMSLIKQKQVG